MIGSCRTVLVLVVALWLASTEASCPHQCSGNGNCNKYSKCECAKGWMGPSCALRTCPYERAWFDMASATDIAHGLAECSNRGNCNREKGVCVCQKGFEGKACERMSCADHCNHAGQCTSLHDYASRYRNVLSQRFLYEDRPHVMEGWDAHKIRSCVCDGDHTGYDCSKLNCATGDDPLTKGQVNEIQLLHCRATIGSFHMLYKGEPSAEIEYTATAAMVEEALRSIKILGDVKATSSQGSSAAVCDTRNANIVSIEFLQNFGPQPPMVAQMSSEMTADAGSVSVAAHGVTFLDAHGRIVQSMQGTKENAPCSNRGECNKQIGQCVCYNTNGDAYSSSDGNGNAGNRGDCGANIKTDGNVAGTCPGDIPCSGNGLCRETKSNPDGTATYTCECMGNYHGGDCSQKKCPTGLAWFSYPAGDYIAHSDYMECSNMGHCDVSTGKCQCRESFTGEACEIMDCPTEITGGTDIKCSGHGRCLSMAERALWADDNGVATDRVYGTDPNNWATWDYNRIYGCMCDEGWDGYDCSLRTCPTGDDPGTYEDHVEVQILQCLADDGNYTLSFRQHETKLLSYDSTASQMEEALQELPSIKNGIAVFFFKDELWPNGTLNYDPPEKVKHGGDLDDKDRTIRGYKQWLGGVSKNANGTWNFFPRNNTHPYSSLNSTFCDTMGEQKAIIFFSHNHGNLPNLRPDSHWLSDGVNGNGRPDSGVINVFSDGAEIGGLKSIKGTTEDEPCNGRGDCDTSTGQCICYQDWSSSDGTRQPGPGNTGDCGHRSNAGLYDVSTYKKIFAR